MLYGINTETLECLICISWYYRIIDEMKYLKFAKNENNLLAFVLSLVEIGPVVLE